VRTKRRSESGTLGGSIGQRKKAREDAGQKAYDENSEGRKESRSSLPSYIRKVLKEP